MSRPAHRQAGPRAPAKGGVGMVSSLEVGNPQAGHRDQEVSCTFGRGMGKENK